MKRYGGVESIQSGCNECLFVQFADRQIAMELLKRGRIEIDGIQFQVKKVKEIHDPIRGLCDHNIKYKIARSLLKAPAIDSPQNILNALDDSCLYEIVAKIRDISDYMSIADVCTRFKRIAQQTFVLQRKIFRFDYLVKNGKFKMSRLEHFLENFGSSILMAQLHFNSCSFENLTTMPNQALQLINQHCNRITDLTICIGQKNRNTNWMELQSVLPNLKRLKIMCLHLSMVGKLTDFLAACSELEHLNISGEFHSFHLPNKTMPKLKHLLLLTHHLTHFEDTLIPFLEVNPQLEVVCLPLDESVIEFLDGNTRNLKAITLKQSRIGDTSLERLRVSDLRNVELHLYLLLDNNSTMMNILSRRQIRELTIRLFQPFTTNDLLDLLRRLPNLQYLSIKISDKNCWITKSVIKQLIECAPNLTELIITNNQNELIQFDEADYDKIVQSINSQSRKDKLIIIINGSTTLFSNTNYKRKIDILNTHPNKLTVAKSYTIHKHETTSFRKHIGFIFIMVVKILVLGFIFFRI